MPTDSTPFLNALPPEIRLQIYSYLLVSPVPIKGTLARSFPSETYDLHTSILRTNRQIYNEAKHVFLSLNTFHITSASSLASEKYNQHQDSGAFEPPLQLRDLPLIRHLEVDLIYHPRKLRTAPGIDGKGWKPICPGADRYMTSLSFLLGCVKYSLLSLKLVADVRPYTSYDMDATDYESSMDVRKYLTGFHAGDSSWRLQDALANLPPKTIDLRFDFPESYFAFSLQKETLKKKDLAVLAGQVLIARSEMQMKVAVDDLGDGDEDSKDESLDIPIEKLSKLEEITVEWPTKDE